MKSLGAGASSFRLSAAFGGNDMSPFTGIKRGVASRDREEGAHARGRAASPGRSAGIRGAGDTGREDPALSGAADLFKRLAGTREAAGARGAAAQAAAGGHRFHFADFHVHLIQVGVLQHHFIGALSHQETGVAQVVFRLHLISREHRVDGLRGIENAVEELVASVFLPDAAEIGTEVSTAVADTVALKTLHAAFDEEYLLAARGVALERKNFTRLDVRAESFDTSFFGNKPLEQVAHERVRVRRAAFNHCGMQHRA